MIKILVPIFLLACLNISAQKLKPIDPNSWRAELQREDGNNIIFKFNLKNENGKKVMYVTNAAEKIRVDNIRFVGDSVFISMPVFESSFKAKVSLGKWEGMWTKKTVGKDQVMPFIAYISDKRFEPVNGNPSANITGRWAINFESDHSKKPLAIAEFSQTGEIVSGTFLTPSGDYRYQEGIVTGDQLKLSGFDGVHAYLFTATIGKNKTLTNGQFISGKTFKDSWTGVKDPKAKVSTDEVAMFLKPGESKLDFRFKDLNGKEVSINEERFKDKVIIIQLMGSWCPNCMDETAFLSDYYNKNKDRGIEIIALAYEYSTDWERSVASVSKFQKRFDVKYPILITGVTVKDSLRTEKTLPQLTPIKVFPSTIILDKIGNVRKIETDFFGPGTGEHYNVYKKQFYATVDALLKERP